MVGTLHLEHFCLTLTQELPWAAGIENRSISESFVCFLHRDKVDNHGRDLEVASKILAKTRIKAYPGKSVQLQPVFIVSRITDLK